MSKGHQRRCLRCWSHRMTHIHLITVPNDWSLTFTECCVRVRYLIHLGFVSCSDWTSFWVCRGWLALRQWVEVKCRFSGVCKYWKIDSEGIKNRSNIVYGGVISWEQEIGYLPPCIWHSLLLVRQHSSLLTHFQIMFAGPSVCAFDYVKHLIYVPVPRKCHKSNLPPHLSSDEFCITQGIETPRQIHDEQSVRGDEIYVRSRSVMLGGRSTGHRLRSPTH